jgi:hypothetical protein
MKMNTRSMLGTIVFGALLAIAYPAFSAALAPWFGRAAALSIYLTTGAGLYAFSLGSGLRERLRAGTLCALLLIPLLLLAPGPVTVAMGAGLVLAVVRSHLLRPGGPGRTLAIEATLGLTALAFVRAIAGPSPLEVSLALWGYFLIQSVYFAIGGVTARSPRPGAIDPFDLARERAEALLREDMA